MTTTIFTHDDCLEHDTGPGHPERTERLEVVLEALRGEMFHGRLNWRDAPMATAEQIARVHPLDHMNNIRDSAPASGYARLDADTVMSPGSYHAALRAAGAVCAAVDAVIGGETGNAFCAVRPPGHHAEPSQAMGFCLFNNIAVGAMQARAVHGMDKVAIIDFDVHHGNGSQAAFQADPRAFYASTHQAPLYPGTGAATETGVGNIHNFPMAACSDSTAFRKVMSDKLLPALDRFAPDMVLISAGFDAHVSDPLAQLDLGEEDFAWVTSAIMKIADKHCAGRVVSALEGGYNLDALGPCVAAHVQALLAE